MSFNVEFELTDPVTCSTVSRSSTGTCTAVEVTTFRLSEWITCSRAADLFDSSLLQLSAAAWQQSFLLVAKTVKFIPSHSSNCHRGETESRLSHLWEMAAHDNDPALFSSLSLHNKTVQGHISARTRSFLQSNHR